MPFAGDPDEAASALARYVRKVIGDDGASPSTISSSPGVYSHSTHKFSVVEIGRLLKKVEFFRNLQLPHSIFDLIAHTFTVETFGASSHIDLKRDVGKVHLILDRSVTVCKRNGENSPQRLFPCVAGDCCGAGVCNRYSMLDDDAQGEASLLAETDSATTMVLLIPQRLITNPRQGTLFAHIQLTPRLLVAVMQSPEGTAPQLRASVC